LRASALVLTIVASLVAAPAAFGQTSTGGTDTSSTPATTVTPAATGGAAYGQPNPATTQLTPEQTATILPTGYAAAPASAPQEVQDAIAAANAIVGKPYIYGGGHNAKFLSRGYDCSGTVSYALHGAGLLDSPLDSGSFMKWGAKGPGTWITVYTNPGHAFAVIAGLRLDTSAAGDPSGAKGPRWRPVLRSTKGFTARHPDGF
jgi:cell wall-associated NlpC family hydrolase